MHHHQLRRAFAAAMAVATLAVTPPAAADEPAGVEYQPPVDAAVADRFRPPATEFGAGNRGIDYATVAGTPVRASAPGTVTFAGRIGPSVHVVVLHADGMRTSYSFLSGAGVGRGDQVAAGHVVGWTAGALHFGVRAGDEYLDPLTLLTAGPPRVHLVPHGDVRPASVAEERRGLLRSLGRAAMGGLDVAGRAATAGVDWARSAGARAAGSVSSATGEAVRHLADRWRAAAGDLRAVLHLLGESSEVVRFVRVLRAMARWAGTECTPPSVTPPPVSERRIALLVGGLGSSSSDAGVLDVDTVRLGYRPDDVVQFSYRGGVVPGHGSLAGVPTSGYSASHTLVDLHDSAAALRATLEAIRHHHPGVPVDLIAHSQGGLVARLALGRETDHLDPRLPPIRTVVTLGTPHRGADLATAADALDGSLAGTAALSGVDRGTGLVGPSMLQMSETAGVIGDLRRRRLPDGAHVVSVAAAGDLVVAAPNSRLDGAHNVTVGLAGPEAHGDLSGSAVAHREIALARAGLPPTCQPFLTALHRSATGELVGLASDRLGLALNLGARWADRGFPSLGAPRT